MIGRNYEEYRQLALKHYDSFKELFRLVSEKEWASQIDAKALEAQAKSIAREKFTLMVVGEAKSGKSSFINAYLKTDLLPVSTDQCTSAIITIHYAEKERLTYYTAGGEKHEKKKSGTIRKFLEQNAAMREKYRRIPVAFLDDLVVGWGKRGDLKNDKVPDRLVKLAIELTKDDNITNCPKKEYEEAIRDYLKMRSCHWKDIVDNIEIGYPFSPEMKDVCIVDSPGVNARGGVGELTEKKIKEANAVVFIKSAVGQGLESKSFNQFMNTVNAGWHEESLFLLLSRFGDLSRTEKEQTIRSAKRLFKNYVGEERIVPIDSKVKWYINKFERMTEDEIDDFVSEEYENEEDYDVVSKRWFKKSSLPEFFAKMEEIAGFRSIDVLFDKYAKTAHCVTLTNFLSLLHDNYTKIQAYLSGDEETIQEKISCPPDEWKRKIAKKKKELETLQSQVDISLEDLKKSYDGKNGVVNRYKDKIVAQINETIDAVNDYNFFRKMITQITSPLLAMKQAFFSQVIEDCNKILSVRCDTMDFEDWKKAILVQSISEEEANAIVSTIEKSNDVIYAVDEGTTFKDIHYYFDPNECLRRVKYSIKTTLDAKAKLAAEQTLSYVGVIIDKYKEKLNAAIEVEQGRYDKYLEDQRSDKELEDEVIVLNSFLSVTKKALSELESLRQELNHRGDGQA